jgi:hypothetical protein
VHTANAASSRSAPCSDGKTGTSTTPRAPKIAKSYHSTTFPTHAATSARRDATGTASASVSIERPATAVRLVEQLLGGRGLLRR